MARIHSRLAFLAAGIFLTSPTWGMDLMQAYRQAAEADANYQAAKATLEAAREAVPQARAALLPVIGITSSRSKIKGQQISQTILGPTTSDLDYDSKSDAITLRQPIVRVGSYIQLGQAESQVAAAEATFAHEAQVLAQRVSAAYFDALLARERVESFRTQKSAFAAQLELSERAFKAGEGTRTDIDDARSRYLMATAQEIEALAAQDKAEKALAAILGKNISSGELAGLSPKRLVLAPPKPASFDEWMALAEEGNHELRSLRHQLEVAQSEISKARAQHLPTLDLVMSRSHSLSDTVTSAGNEYRYSSIGVQLNVPLFSGGSVLSATRQASANAERVRQQLEAARRQLSVMVSTEFGGVMNGMARIAALEAAVEAASQAVVSTRKGVQAGTRNTVDILNAEQQLATVRVDLGKARYDYVMARLRLKAAAGMLGEADIGETSRWLVR